MNALDGTKTIVCAECGELIEYFYNPPKRCFYCMEILGEHKMNEECVVGVKNAANIKNLSDSVKDINDKDLPNIRECIGKKVSSVFVSIGILVLAGLLAIIYNGQREISKDIIVIKIEQSKVTSQFEIHENRFDRIDEKMSEIKNKLKRK